jgi:hypothetical protein
MNDITQNLQESGLRIVNDISTLQTIQSELLDELTIQIKNGSLTDEQIQTKENTILEIANMKNTLLKNIQNLNNISGQNIDITNNTLKEQIVTNNIVEDQIRSLKEKKILLEKEKNNKLRLVEINNNYKDRYKSNVQLLKVICIVVFIILLCTVLLNFSLIPKFLYVIIVSLDIFIGIIFVFYLSYNIWSRNNMDYQQYDWYFDPQTAPTVNVSSTLNQSSQSNPWKMSSLLNNCVDDSCCGVNTKFNSTLSQCVGITGSSSTSTGVSGPTGTTL